MQLTDTQIQSLRCARFDPMAVRCIDALSGGFRWTDEFPQDFVDEAMQGNWAHRGLIAHRAAITLGEHAGHFESLWAQVQEACPNWPGLRSERCAAGLAPSLEAERQRVADELELLFDSPN